MLVYINNIYTIKSYLREHFVNQTNPDIMIKLVNCIELIDLLPYNENGYKLEYKDQLRVIKARKPILENKVVL